MYHGQRKYTRDNVPDEVYLALMDCIEEQGLECADNFRYSPSDDNEGLSQFEEIAESGCCGSANFQVQDATGRTWLVGCNYGH